MTQLVHVLVARGHYIGQVRKHGHHLWETVEGQHTSPEKAMVAAVLKMTPDHKRARVLFVDDSGWYGPELRMECSR